METVLIIVNKWWECEPVMNVLLNDDASPAKALGWPTTLNHPHRRGVFLRGPNPTPQPRAVFSMTNIAAEIWCISDLLEDLPDTPKFQSSSERKIERLPLIFKGSEPDLVIAVGTAGFPSDGNENENGSVVIGTGVFMHDCHPNGTNPDSKWSDCRFEELLCSAITPKQFTAITKFDAAVPDLLMTAVLNPACKSRILADTDGVALGAVNVTNYDKYNHTDQETIDAYKAKCPKRMRDAKSLETTHGLIRAQSDAPFMFVSGIPDRVGHFDDEVKPRRYAQNAVAAHNAGIAIAWMLPNIGGALQCDRTDGASQTHAGN